MNSERWAECRLPIKRCASQGQSVCVSGFYALNPKLPILWQMIRSTKVKPLAVSCSIARQAVSDCYINSEVDAEQYLYGMIILRPGMLLPCYTILRLPSNIDVEMLRFRVSN